ncbi:MAG: hypothetical protein IJW20_03485 [Clostridia bacterium]|nr:hypothetical protein [Clostridia bacterium]
MKKILKKIRDSILEKILENVTKISITITLIIMFIFSKTLIEYFWNYKSEILNMLISISGTLFGFILTFLSIFIVFKTDEKYKLTTENENNPLILYVNNEAFLRIYKLFMDSSYSLGILLIISIIYYFTTYGLNYIINFLFIIMIMGLVTESAIRILLSIYTFNLFIKILINSDEK